MKRHFLLLGLLSFLIACQSSPPKYYYLLSPSAPASSIDHQSITHLVGIGPVELADYLDRLNMVSMNTDNSLQFLKNDYWAEPLDKGILRILELNLTQKNPSRMMQEFPWRSDSIPDYSLRLQVHELTVSNGNAKINVTWELFDTKSKQAIERQHFISSIATANSADAIAKAYSQLFSQLTDNMDKALEKVE